MEKKCNDPDCTHPDCDCWEQKKRFSQTRIVQLEMALKLAKEMMVANDLILSHTFEVIDDALCINQK